MNFGLGGSPTSVYAHRTWEKKEKLGQRPIQISPGEKNFAARLGVQSELGAGTSRKAVWWDLRLASLLTHLFLPAWRYATLVLASGSVSVHPSVRHKPIFY